MTNYEQGYIDGLNAAAMLCEWESKGKESRFAPLIRSMAQKMILKLEMAVKNKDGATL